LGLQTIEKSEANSTLGNLRSSTSIQMYPTSRRLAQFSQGRAPGPNDTIVYVDGSWDLFQAGQSEFLKKKQNHLELFSMLESLMTMKSTNEEDLIGQL